MMLRLCAVLCLISVALGYDILCLTPMPFKSHHNIGRGVVKALLKAGHSVTWATAFPDKDNGHNLTYIDLSHIIPYMDAFDMSDPSNNQNVTTSNEMKKIVNNALLGNEQLKHLLVTKQFDAVINEWFFNDAYAGFAAVQQAPWILLSGVTMHPILEQLMDEVRSLSTTPLFMYPWSVPMTMYQRVLNVFTAITMTFKLYPSIAKEVETYERYFAPLAAARGVALPPYNDALHNVSVLLVNSHPSFSLVQSLPPNVVDIAGYHMDEPTPALPSDLQELLDKSSQGVVYFSMGTVLQPNALSLQARRDLLATFRALPHAVLWKYDPELLEDVPPNVHVRKWLPQASVLAHPNTRLFISHGGLLSTIEAIHSGKPLLAVPVFGDQQFNADRAVAVGIALKADYGPNVAQQIHDKLAIMLSTDIYRKRAVELSALFRKRPVSPRDLLVHYVELAIQTKGAYHLRPVSRLYKWYERYMLDVLLCLILIVYLLKFAARCVFRMCWSKEEKKQKIN